MSNMFSNLQIDPADFTPLSAVQPVEVDSVRVSISPARASGARKASARLNISFSEGIGKKIGVTEKSLVAVFMGAIGSGQLLVCSRDAGKAAFPNASPSLYTVHASGMSGGNSARRTACQVPWWCVTSHQKTVDAKKFDIADAALLIHLPDSFIHPDYLRAEIQSSATPEQMKQEQTKQVEAAATSDEVDASPDEQIAESDLVDLRVEPAMHVDTALKDETASVVPAEPLESEPLESTFNQDVEALYAALLGVAHAGVECPTLKVFAKTLFEGEESSENYIRNLFEKLRSDGRIEWGFVDRSGQSHDIGAKGRTRVIEFLSGDEAGLHTLRPVQPKPDAFVEKATGTSAGSAPVGDAPVGDASKSQQPTVLPPLVKAAARRSEPLKIGGRGRGLSVVEQELQEVVRPNVSTAKADTTDEDFNFLVGRGVAITRNPSPSHPFKIAGRPVTAQDVISRARGLRMLSKGGAR